MHDAPVARPVEPTLAPEDVSSTGGKGLPSHPEHDKVPYIALGFALAGFLPPSLFERLIGFGYFGPLAVPAILAMVGVLFAVIGVLRAVDWKDQRALRWSVAAGVVALGRLFLVPFL